MSDGQELRKPPMTIRKPLLAYFGYMTQDITDLHRKPHLETAMASHTRTWLCRNGWSKEANSPFIREWCRAYIIKPKRENMQ